MADEKDAQGQAPGGESPAKDEKAEKAPKAAKAPREAKETAPEAPGGEAGAKKPAKKKESKNIPFAIANVHASFNNTVITITDQAGNVLSWSSAGCVGFKGSRKGTPFAAQLAAQSAGNAARDHGVRQLEVRVTGPGAGREASVRALQALGLEIRTIKDVTPIPHNGCRAPKRRRV
jgi:small subunit ribosomal protein S11